MIFRRVFFIAFFSMFYVAGISITYDGVQGIRLARAVMKWPTVTAHLDSCLVERPVNSTEDVVHAAVKYTYTVAGVQYTGDQLEVDHWASSNREKHEAVCRGLVGMTPLIIRYFPRKPELSFILAPEHSWISGRLIFGVVWLLFVTCMVAALVTAKEDTDE
jgi:hypothetical protein